MNTQTIQRQYDEVVAEHYDFDPQGVTAGSLDRALAQLRAWASGDGPDPLRVLDLGMGTGLFLGRLAALFGDRVVPFGVDVSEKMIDRARGRVPGLTAAVDTAARFDAHFPGQSFDLVCTHLVTGFVPMRVLAPLIHARLDDGGCWSFVGGTMAGFPALQAKADAPLVRWLGGKPAVAADEIVCNPVDRDEVVRTLEENGFAVRACETFEPKVEFPDFDRFIEFAYRGGWLTPFVEAAGLHKAGWLTQFLMNRFVFPMTDKHNVVIALAEKVEG
ncbi:class I SAM-dependent methyltransferase [bacterium]|nr:class I SAM-dependent methyltransferase [bacterium]